MDSKPPSKLTTSPLTTDGTIADMKKKKKKDRLDEGILDTTGRKRSKNSPDDQDHPYPLAYEDASSTGIQFPQSPAILLD
eukprot:scaffold37476_cov183-Amphora_coffeaeformis.AAC.1